MEELNQHILKTVFNDYTLFAAFKLSGYLTLVDKRGKPVILNINGNNHIFTFNKNHKEINIGESKKGFSFYEKLFIAGLLNPEYKWKNLIAFQFKKIVSEYIAIEPRNFSVKIVDGKPVFSV